MAENSLQAIAQYLEQSLNPANAKLAELQLRSIESQPLFAVNLLHVVALTNLSASVRLAGALFLKNLVKRKWANEDGEHLLFALDVEYIKTEIINVMIKLPGNLQLQLGETVSLIAELDFPHNWQNLIDELVSKLSPDDFVLNRGLLLVAHLIFKKWRPLFRSDELFLEIKMVLDKFAHPFMALLKRLDELVDTAVAADDGASLGIYLESLLLAVQIYYDLNCQDIPEFFEDNLTAGMSLMHKYLEFQSKLVGDALDDEHADVLIKTKTAIIELLQLYITRYAEEFEPCIEGFITTVWNLINRYVTAQQKYDLLAVSALSFLTSVLQISKYQLFFSSEQAIKEIIEVIILPNIAFREVDEENFEDEPIQFVRSDLEGSDFESRRKASTDFLRELKEVNPELLTSTLTEYINRFLGQSDWHSRDIAIYLFSALAAKGSVTNIGVTSTNLLVDVVHFFTDNIGSYLVEDVSPVLKTDAIKYIMTFRNQLTKEQLLTTIPLLVTHLKHNNVVVYTYAAITIDSLFSMTSFSTHQAVFEKSDVQPFVTDLLGNLFTLILSQSASEKLSENEFLIKLVTRVIATAQDSIEESFRVTIMEQLLKILGIISKNPSNPRFTHHVFESLGLLIKVSTGKAGENVPSLMNLLLGPLLNILSEDVQEFVPYTFQVLAYLLEQLPRAAELPSQYRELIKPLLSPVVWEFLGNIPGITRLLIAILSHTPTAFATTPQELTPLLGVFQKLIASRARDNLGFDLLEAILLAIPLSMLSQYLNQIGIILLSRLKTLRTDKYVKRFVLFFLSLAAVPLNPELHSKCAGHINADFAIGLIESVQGGVFGQIYNSFIMPTSGDFANLRDKKVALIGYSQVVTSLALTTGEYKVLLVPSIEQFCKNAASLEGIQKSTNAAANAMAGAASGIVPDADYESVAYGANFSRIISIQNAPFDPLPEVANDDFKAIRAGAISKVRTLEPLGVFGMLTAEAKQTLS